MTATSPVQVREEEPPPAAGAVGRPALTRLWHPLTLICLLQAALSLSLVWSNTAFGDEAWYLWLGRLALRHWLHGAAWPSQEDHISGSVFIYPPLAALANDVGGLAGARILSLAFMLTSTVLLYLAANQLIGRTGALFATAVWATSEPVIRAAFATFDPMSVFLATVSGYLIVQAGYRRRGSWYVAAAAVALALSSATAYSGMVIDPAVIGFGFLVWLDRLGAWRALRNSALLVAVLAIGFPVALIVARSTAGLAAIFHRTHNDHQELGLVVNDIWKYSGLVIVLAVIGGAAALFSERRARAALLVFLGACIGVIPAAQLYFQTGWALDKHLAYGIWFAAIAAGYGCAALLRWLPGASKRLAVACALIALCFPAVSNWQLAWGQFHTWEDDSAFIGAFSRAVAGRTSDGKLIYASGQAHVAEYYTPQGNAWQSWSADGLSLAPRLRRGQDYTQYYKTTLHSRQYSVIALFYNTTFTTGTVLSGGLILRPGQSRSYDRLVGLLGRNTGDPGLSALTLALERSKNYRLVSVGPFNTASLSGGHDYGEYAIWVLRRTTTLTGQPQ
jgi:hypothetical protein